VKDVRRVCKFLRIDKFMTGGGNSATWGNDPDSPSCTVSPGPSHAIAFLDLGVSLG
jgi:hypothetical protein